MFIKNAIHNLKKSLISSKVSIQKGVLALDKAGTGILIISDDASTLLGVVTDGNIRRAILKGIDFSDDLISISTTDPVTICSIVSIVEAKKLMDKGKNFYVNHLPLLDEYGKLKGLLLRKDLDQLKPQIFDNPVVLMAGGLGTRLRPLTSDCPKPMLKVGKKPILETIITNFKEQGFWNFYIAVNYKSEMVQDYFDDGSKFGVTITYLQETQRLGTAGALSLIPKRSDKPMIVMNGDILTKVDFQKLMDYHLSSQAIATMCVREYDFQVPYGVVKVNGSCLKELQEKPTHSFFVNAGVYVLKAEVLDFIPNDTFFDITTLFNNFLKENRNLTVFPIREYWIDIGQMHDFEKANGEFQRHF